jgi:hypothetical protein
MNMPGLDEILATDERFSARNITRLTPEERLASMEKMQQAFAKLLRESPELNAEVIARNFKLRATDPDHPQDNLSTVQFHSWAR